jgi:hypothetical protein
MSYLIVDTFRFVCAITAGHVIDYLVSLNLDTCYIRPSWADSIKTSVWVGMPCILRKYGNNLYFRPKDKSIDLGCLLASPIDKVSLQYYAQNPYRSFPYNSIDNPSLGEEVIILGYPGHVENEFNKFDYSVCTIKPGMVSWISLSKINSEIDNLLLVESNATHGNSGGPVFSKSGKNMGNLIGIVVGGLPDDTPLPIMIGNKTLVDSASKSIYYTIAKSGITTVVKAKLVRDFIEEVNSKVKSMLGKP